MPIVPGGFLNILQKRGAAQLFKHSSDQSLLSVGNSDILAFGLELRNHKNGKTDISGKQKHLQCAQG